jgi:hypothetical protein
MSAGSVRTLPLIARATRSLTAVAETRGQMDKNNGAGAGTTPPGIVIQHPTAPDTRPTVSAFIWGFKVDPVPSLPYGRSKS